MHEHTNQLVHEKSPYLLQHAHNPVNWLPWGPKAFDTAVREDKPVFLSVGYAACHWCHVMERESFEDQETARLLNEHFVCVKVDREERPDIDGVYMEACLRLARLLGRPDLEEKARKSIRTFAREVRNHPEGYLHFLCGVEYATYESTEIILAGEPGAKDMAKMVEALGRAYLPQVAILMSHEALEQQVPFLGGCPVVKGKATAYLCRNNACKPPITDPDKLLKALGVTDC